MGNNFQFLEIIFFAMVAIFILLRLKNVLGRRTGNEPTNNNRYKDNSSQKKSDLSNVVKLAEKKTSDIQDQNNEEKSEIVDLYPEFDQIDFLDGASKAYEMILASYANADYDTLRALLDDDVYNDFYTAIDQRNEKGEKLETTVVSINLKEIIDTSIKDTVIEITVKFSTEVINVIRDKNGEITSNKDSGIDSIIDIWTFSRDTRSSDLNWKLIATQNEIE